MVNLTQLCYESYYYIEFNIIITDYVIVYSDYVTQWVIIGFMKSNVLIIGKIQS